MVFKFFFLIILIPLVTVHCGPVARGRLCITFMMRRAACPQVCVLGSSQSDFYMFAHLILIIMGDGCCYYPHFMDVGMRYSEVVGGPGSHSQEFNVLVTVIHIGLPRWLGG